MKAAKEAYTAPGREELNAQAAAEGGGVEEPGGRGFGFLEFDDVGGTLAGTDRSGNRPGRS